MPDITKIYGNARFKIRNDTYRNWEKENPILLEGEPGVVNGLESKGDGKEDKTKKIKFGDGITPWNELGWWEGPQGIQGEQGIPGEKGEKGEQGIPGQKGEKGEDAKTDQIYDPESENAQSGKALAPVFQKISGAIGDISTALDELHTYAQALITGGATE